MQIDNIIKIYELRDPRDPECKPRYVGMTSRTLEIRLKDHIRRVNFKYHKAVWINSLLKLGIIPTIHLIEEVNNFDKACEVEKYWIREFRFIGDILWNY